jgi:hypothetical protein
LFVLNLRSGRGGVSHTARTSSGGRLVIAGDGPAARDPLRGGPGFRPAAPAVSPDGGPSSRGPRAESDGSLGLPAGGADVRRRDSGPGSAV